MEIEKVTREIEKIQAIADLLVSHTNEEFGIIGLLLSDISFPLLKKLKDRELTVRKE